MSIQALNLYAGNAGPAAADGSSTRPSAMDSRKVVSRVIGALFLLGFVSYGVGFAIVSPMIAAPDFLAAIPARQTLFVFGAFLMLLNTVVDVGKGVLFFPILEKQGKRTALAYLAMMIFEVILLDIGVLCLLMIVPLAHQAIDAGPASADWTRALGSLAVQSNTMAYQIAEMSLSLGCVFLCSLLYRLRLIPRLLSIWGFFGYVILMAGTIAEVFGIHVGLLLSLPGGLFELTLGFWLLIKGFEPAAYAQAVAE
jgi:hypothetical protein